MVDGRISLRTPQRVAVMPTGILKLRSSRTPFKYEWKLRALCEATAKADLRLTIMIDPCGVQTKIMHNIN